jgi:hypothetical protein
MIGKLGTLSKAPPVFFVLQLLFFGLLLSGRRLGWKSIAFMLLAAIGLFALVVGLVIPDIGFGGVMAFLYYRAFDIPNEVLVEYFAAIPASLPHGHGAGIFAFLSPDGGAPPLPTYVAVAELIRGSLMSTSNAMFIADAWAEFGWIGVGLFALIAGFTVRAIDLYAFRHGESDESACLVAGCAYGVFTMLATSLTTALVTGGLATLPLISALFVRQRSIATKPVGVDDRVFVTPGGRESRA